ncbi:2-oxo-4-hydroxy-4-carboxy-5-ureidoimidazoline decarboxylase [Sphaerisporangium sp. TRM90804]|uniref:2-oxo-4-hydroxy-4-carboxy-5-ureidoimidazoline decarboxylase n=1 Tax=Sphaerisporangium sp. TRM90804 TaxID=3031113 RepID=UPI00244AFD12|nr:2-oxo-4-hydroxy-4-carboxy-5-ureidoimidazoline decarboxylase [Sphaerisporangium sp. TRM90804]MDH2428706.1 2-oxo-4-hydroxy-4-carboxy-5-ureidoimidazoline decarboxylase [Sphaerisporangium sp. TRM90804]
MSNVTPAHQALAAFNALSPAEAERELLTCCASREFARRVAGSRPYGAPGDLVAAAAAAVAGLEWPDVLEALDAHPRIGERAAGASRESSWSRDEQSGTAGADRRVLAELAAGNAEYERRFGHVYLVCATGLSAPEMLERLRSRLDGDPEAEPAVVREELGKITRLRVAKLLAGNEPG